MDKSYLNFIRQTLSFPNQNFALKNNELEFRGMPIMPLLERFDSPLKISYLPVIGENINNAKTYFKKARKELNYKGEYHYAYCTKSSHFSFILKEVLQHEVHLETSSAFDIDIIKNLAAQKLINPESFIIGNGFKTQEYLSKLINLSNRGINNVIPVMDSPAEIEEISKLADRPMQIGLRIASEEEPTFPFYTSRLGIGYKYIMPIYKNIIEGNSNLNLTMLHFFINTGIKDSSYYWDELRKCIQVYIDLKKINPKLKYFNIGGGFPIPHSLKFSFDYEKMIYEILHQVKSMCNANDVEEPDIFTEFGSYTVGESGAMFFKIIGQKKQNDREKWNMINGSFITSLPDAWSLGRRFIMLPINHWDKQYEQVLLGGMTCDSDDYYNSEQHVNSIYLPRFHGEKDPLYIGFFNTGAYQESLSGYGGIKHCLIPESKHVIISKDQTGQLQYNLFRKETAPEDYLKILGY